MKSHPSLLAVLQALSPKSLSQPIRAFLRPSNRVYHRVASVLLLLLALGFAPPAQGGVGRQSLLMGLGEVVNGVLSQPSELERFTFNGTVGQRVFFDSLNPTNRAGWNIRLTAPNGEQVFDVDADLDAGPYYLLETGTYLLELRSEQGATGEYSYRLLDVAAATELAVNSTVSGQAIPPLAAQLYRFEGSAGQRIQALSSGACGPNGTWAVNDVANQAVLSGSVSAGGDLGSVVLERSGTCLVAVSNPDPTGSAYNYLIRVNRFDPAAVSPAGFNEVHEGGVAAGEVKTFNFTARAGMAIAVDGQLSDDLADSYLEIRRPDGATFAMIYSSRSDSFAGYDLPNILPASGTYTVRVYGLGSPPSTSAGNFRFRILNLADSPALTMGSTVSVPGSPFRQLDAYRVQLTAGQRVSLDWLVNDGSVLGTLIDAQGLPRFGLGYPYGGDLVQQRIGLSGQGYVLLGRSDESTQANTVRWVDLATAVPVTFDADISGQLDPIGQALWYRFTAQAGQRVLYRGLESSGARVFIDVYQPDFSQFNANYYSYAVMSDQELILPRSGEYVMRFFSDSSPNLPPGTFRFRLNTPDTVSRPLTLGAVTSGNLAEPRERREFTFTGSVGQRLYYDGLEAPSGTWSYLIGPSGTGYNYSWTAHDMLPITLTEAGVWTLRVVTEQGVETGPFAFRLLDVSLAPALPLALNTRVSGTLNSGANPTNGVVIYRFPVIAGQRFFYDSQTNSDVGLLIINPNGSLLNYIPITGDQPDLRPTGTGEGLLVLSTPQASRTAYAFRLNEPFRSITPLTLGAAQTVVVTNAGDQFTFTFNATPGQVFYFDTLTADDNGSGVEAVFLSENGELYSNANDSRPVRFARAGTYAVRVGGLNDLTGRFSFRLLDLTTAPVIAAGANISGTLTAPRQSAVYRFNAAGNERVRFESVSVGAGLSSWSVYSPGLSSLASGSLAENLGEFAVREPGEHYLVIQPHEVSGNLAANQPFTVRRVVTTEPTQELSGFSEVREGTLDPFGNATFTFTAPAGRRVYYDALTDYNGLQVSLLFNGVQLATRSSAWTDGDFLGNKQPLLLPFSGTYTVRIDDANGSGGNYRFRVLDADGASAIAFHTTVSSPPTVGPRETRFFRLPATAGQIAYFDGLVSSVSLFSPSGAPVSNNGYGFWNIWATGDHLVLLSNDADSDLAYRFRVLELAGIDPLPLAFDTPTGVDLPPRQSQFVRLDIAAGQRVFLDQPDGTSPGYLYGPELSVVGSGVDFQYIVTRPGSYYFYLTNDTDSPVTSSIRVSDSPPTTTIPDLALDGSPQTGTLVKPGERRRFTFTGTAGQRICYDDLLENSSGAVSVGLYPPGKEVALGTGPSGYEGYPISLLVSGTWTLMLENTSDGPASYSFRVLNVAAAPRLTWDSPLSTNVPPRELRLFRFAAEPGQRVYLRGQPDFNGSISAYGPDDNWVGDTIGQPRFVLSSGQEHVLVVSSHESVAREVSLTAFLGNHAPVIGEIPDATFDEETTYSVKITATDVEQPNDQIRFSLTGNSPAGATIDSVSGQFTWRPTETQGPGVFPITVVATDDGIPSLSSSRVFTLTVLESNRPPVLAAIGPQKVAEETKLTFTANATDPDLPANGRAYSLGATAPVGASIDATTGKFAWTPTEAQGPGTFTFDVIVTDSSTDARAPHLTDTKLVTVTVTEVNRPPVLVKIPDQTLDELEPLTLNAVATDPDLPPNGRTYTLGQGAPIGVAIDAVTGQLTWIPSEAQGPGLYPVTVIVSDSGSADAANPVLKASQTFNITVNEVNLAPTLSEVPDQIVTEGELFEIDLQGTDADLPEQTLTYTAASGAPSGLVVDPATGRLTWTPTEEQGPSTNTVTVTVTDNFVPTALTASRTFTVVVRETNSAPVLSSVPEQTVAENSALALQLIAKDNDLPTQPLAYNLVTGPMGLTVSTNGAVAWTPSESQGPSTNSVTVRVTDGVAEDLKTFTAIVTEVNEVPVLMLVPDVTVAELAPLAIQLTAEDADQPAQILTYNVIKGPTGMTVSKTGAVAWTPTEAQGPSTNSVTVRVSDGELEDTQTFTVIVTEVNVAPVLAEIPNQKIDELTALALTANASDTDLPANGRTFSLGAGAPDGLTINAASGALAWTPTEVQGPDSYPVTVIVSDSGSADVANPVLSASRSFTITVNEVNVAPVLAAVPLQSLNATNSLSLELTATDADRPEQSLTFQRESGPDGLVISPAGLVEWTPPVPRVPGTNVVRVCVSDGVAAPVCGEFLVVIAIENSAPLVGPIDDQTVVEGQPLRFTIVASDKDLPAQKLIFSLDTNAPAGALVDPQSGEFTWTPTEAEGPSTNQVTVLVSDNGTPPMVGRRSFQIVVWETNAAPVLAAILDQTIAVVTPLNLTLTATDEDIPVQPLTFSLVNGPPGMTVSTNGLLAWTPTVAQGPSTNTVTVRVSDGTATDEQTFVVIVTKTIEPPVLGPILDQTIPEQTLLALALTATDSNVPARILTFSLVAGPKGMEVTPAGALTWTPTEAQGPSTNTVTVGASNGEREDTKTFTVMVKEVNTAPVLTGVPEVTLDCSEPLVLELQAKDDDLPAQILTWDLVTGPTGITVSATGAIVGTPSEFQCPSTNTVVVQVTDNGEPPLSATIQIRIMVAPLPELRAQLDGARLVLTWRHTSHPLRVERATSLSVPSWEPINTPVISGAEGDSMSFDITEEQSFYRLAP